MSDSDELKQMTERAMIAEARVAELLEKQSQIGGDKSLSGSLSSAAGDAQLRKRAEAAEAQREELRSQNKKLEADLEEEEEKLRKTLEELDKAKRDQERIAQLEEKLKQAPDTSELELQIKTKDEEVAQLTTILQEKQDALQKVQRELEQARQAAAAPPPLPPPAQDYSKLEEQLKSKNEELAGLSSAIQEKEAVIEELTQRAESIPLIEAERDGLAKEVENLRAQAEQAKAQPAPDPEMVDHLKNELEEMAGKMIASADEAQRLTRENADLQQRVSELQRDNLELIKRADNARDEISIVSQSRADGTLPETLPPPQQESQEVIAGTPISAPQAAAERSEAVPIGAPQTEPAADDVPEDSLPEVEPLPATVPAAPPRELLVPRPKKSGLLWKFFLFLILAGGAFFAAWHFYPELFDFLKDKPTAEEAVAPEPEPAETAPAPAPEVPKEPAEEPPEETPAEEQEVKPAIEMPKEPAEKSAAKEKSRKKKRTPKKVARVIEDKMSVSEAKRQIRRMIAAKQLNEARKMLAEWVKKKPKDAGLHYLYGRLYLMLGKKNQAVDQLEEAIDLAPRMSSAYHDLGAVYLQLGDNESACEALGKFVRLKPNHPRAPAIRDLMKKIKCK